MTTQLDGSGTMFDRIAKKYDLLNRINSLGLDHGWRRRAVGALAVNPHDRVLDLATGTADVALRIALEHPQAAVVGVDPSAGMLGVGRRKVEDAHEDGRIELREGDATSLEFADRSFERAIMAFGIRNVHDRPAALREIFRVLTPGGRLVILELGEPERGPLQPFARFHMEQIVPQVGRLLVGGDEYRYLRESISAFPSREDFNQMLAECGFAVEPVEVMGFGACSLFVGVKPS